jgi:hypothetical protein
MITNSITIIDTKMNFFHVLLILIIVFSFQSYDGNTQQSSEQNNSKSHNEQINSAIAQTNMDIVFTVEQILDNHGIQSIDYKFISIWYHDNEFRILVRASNKHDSKRYIYNIVIYEKEGVLVEKSFNESSICGF